MVFFGVNFILQKFCLCKKKWQISGMLVPSLPQRKMKLNVTNMFSGACRQSWSIIAHCKLLFFGFCICHCLVHNFSLCVSYRTHLTVVCIWLEARHSEYNTCSKIQYMQWITIQQCVPKGRHSETRTCADRLSRAFNRQVWLQSYGFHIKTDGIDITWNEIVGL